MKLAISNIAWNPNNKSKVLSLLSKYEINKLEIAPGLLLDNCKSPYSCSIDRLHSLKKEYRREGFELVSMQSILFGSNELTLFDSKETRAKLYNYCKDAIKFASQLDIKNIVFGSPKNRVIPNTMIYLEAEEIAINFFKDLGRIAFNEGVILSLEPNASNYGCNFLTNTIDTVDFITKLNCEAIKLNLDMGTMSLNNEKPEIIISVAKHINHIHISEPYLEKVPQKINQHISRASILKKINYKNTVSIEMKKSDDEKSLKNIEDSISFVKEIYSS